MKKITDFIVNKRYWILGLFIILLVIAAILSRQVNINYDISRYLPNTSETRIGMDIMDSEFEENESSFNIMFKGLTEEKKDEIYNYLVSVNGVSSVDYEKNENYNKEDSTLYVVNVDDKEDSNLAKEVYNEITNKYKNDEIYTSGAIAERNTDVLPMWIIVLAVSCAIIILIIMCESYIEPFLFLVTILMAVVLNNGTNIIFDSVSNITNSISAILQMALSMDYSIMLINRYRQEREKESDKVQAMKNALYNAFKSISSSSVTTIVGLLALIFMSFTLGKDLGFVLAKGVLFSLICIFFVLPTLILMFDKLIQKTKKKTPHIKLDTIGKISYKLRYVAIPVFIGIFIFSYFQKGNLDILYTASEDDEISKIFSENNQMAIIYNNKEEKNISEYLEQIKENEHIEDVIAYGNTINKELEFDELNDKLEDLGADVEIDEYLLKILYYKYYNTDEDNKITFNEFVDFIQNEVYENQNMSDELNDKTKENVERFKNFTSSELVNKKRNSSEIANILGIDKNQINDILVYYNSKNNNIKISLNDFIKFINSDVLTNKTYSKRIDNTAKEKLNQLIKFTDVYTIQKKMTSEDMANLFGIDKNTIDLLYTYYISLNDIDTKLTLYQFSEFVLNDLLKDSKYANIFDEATINQLKLLNTFSNESIITKEMNSKELSEILGIDEEQINALIYLVQNNTDNWKMTPNEFVKLILTNSDNETIKGSINNETINQLKFLANIMDSSINKKSYSYNELAEFIGINLESSKNIYILYSSEKVTLKLTPKEFVDFILNHKTESTLSDKLDKDTLNNLTLIQKVMSGALEGQKYNSAELSKLLGINENDTKLLYGLYNSKYVNTNQTISLKEFISFLTNDVMKNQEYSENFDNDSKIKINTVNSIIKASENNVKYSKDEIFAILSKLTDDLDKNTVDLLYIYYGSSKDYNDNWTITIEHFVNYLNEDILNDSRFDDFIDNDMKNKITDSKEKINDAKDMLVGDQYSRIIIDTKFDLESEETFEFIQMMKDKLGENINEFYIIGDSPMAYEMSKSFNNELNFITILTMILIFIVVAITFKSLIIPAILVLTIQCAVYTIMGILSFSGEGVYYIALLIVQSILMGATIDYAILYTSYYIEHRKTMDVKNAIINSYNKSIHTILTSASILIIVTLIVGHFSSAITSMICKTISEGALCSAILIILLLPAVIAAVDKIVIKKKYLEKS